MQNYSESKRNLFGVCFTGFLFMGLSRLFAFLKNKAVNEKNKKQPRAGADPPAPHLMQFWKAVQSSWKRASGGAPSSLHFFRIECSALLKSDTYLRGKEKAAGRGRRPRTEGPQQTHSSDRAHDTGAPSEAPTRGNTVCKPGHREAASVRRGAGDGHEDHAAGR